jgi:hypothetical protein
LGVRGRAERLVWLWSNLCCCASGIHAILPSAFLFPPLFLSALVLVCAIAFHGDREACGGIKRTSICITGMRSTFVSEIWQHRCASTLPSACTWLVPSSYQTCVRSVSPASAGGLAEADWRQQWIGCEVGLERGGQGQTSALTDGQAETWWRMTCEVLDADGRPADVSSRGWAVCGEAFQGPR